MPLSLFRGSTVCLDDYAIVDSSTGKLTKERPSTIHQQIAFIIYFVFKAQCRINSVSSGPLNESYLISLLGQNSSVIPGSVIFSVCTLAKLDSCLDFASEIATMQYIAANSDIRVPKIYAYCRKDHCFGLRFLIMEHITPGTPLRVIFPTLSEPQRARFIQSYAALVQSLSKLRFSGIGSLQCTPAGRLSVGAPSRPMSHSVREMIPSHSSMHNTRFSSTLNWLMCTAIDQAAVVALPDPVSTPGATAVKKRIVDGLRKIMEWLPSVVEWYDPTPGIYSLFPGSILVMPSGPEAGRVVAVDSWEGTNILPLWVSCQLPSWLDTSRARNEEYETQFRDDLGRLDDEGLLGLALQMENVQGRGLEVGSGLDLLRSLVHIINQPDVVHIENWLRVYEPALQLKKQQEGYEQQGQQSGSGSGVGRARQASPSTARQSEKQPAQQPVQQPTQKQNRKERGGWMTDGEAVKKKTGKKKTRK